MGQKKWWNAGFQFIAGEEHPQWQEAALAINAQTFYAFVGVLHQQRTTISQCYYSSSQFIAGEEDPQWQEAAVAINARTL